MRYLILLIYSSSLFAIDHNLTYTYESEDITLNAHLMQPQECKELLLHNMHAYQLYPIQLTLTNNGEKTWMLSGNSIEELSLVPPHTITSNIIFKHQTIATLTAYACAVAGWASMFAGFHCIQESIPYVSYSTHALTALATLLSALYQSHRFAERRSLLYQLTQARIIQSGLSGTNITIDPHTTITRIMFLNNKSHLKALSPEDNFYYLFTVKLYNLYKSSDTIIIPVEVPKLYLSPL